MKYITYFAFFIFLIAASGAGYSLYSTKNELESTKRQVKSLKANQRTTEIELSAKQASIDELEKALESDTASLDKAEKAAEQARTEAYTAKQEVNQVQQQLRDAKKEIEALTKLSNELRAEQITHQGELMTDTTTAELAQLKERIAELENANDRLHADLIQAQREKNEASLLHHSIRPTESMSEPIIANMGEPIIESTVSTASEPTPAQARIALISQKNGVVILHGGNSLGLDAGDRVKLVDTRLKGLGHAEIVKVTVYYAVANMLPGTNASALKQGNTVDIVKL